MNLPQPEDRPTIRVDEAAEILGIGRTSAYMAAANGELPTIRLGKRLLVPVASLRRLLGVDDGDAAKTGPDR